jgi:hypothetical protein
MTVPFGSAGTDPTNRISTKFGDVINVPVETLDGYYADTGSRPDVIKIDIEGAEVLALRGAANVLAPGASTRPTLMVAVHPMFLPEFGCSPADLEPLLERYQYGCWTLAECRRVRLTMPSTYSYHGRGRKQSSASSASPPYD